MGKRTTLFWECRAYKGSVQTSTTYGELGDEADTYLSSGYDGEEAEESDEAEILTISPARSIDMKVAYLAACARIDRLEGPQEPEQSETPASASTNNSTVVTATTDIEATETSISMPSAMTAMTGTEMSKARKPGDDPLAAEFSTSHKLFTLVYKVANEQANHRQEPRHRPNKR